METRSHTSRYALVLAALGAAGVVGASAHDVADALGAPTWVIAGITAATGLGAIVAAVAIHLQSQKAEARAQVKKQTDEERDVVTGLLAFLEDRRLLTDDTGYQWHFPDHLRQSAEEIRERTNLALPDD